MSKATILTDKQNKKKIMIMCCINFGNKKPKKITLSIVEMKMNRVLSSKTWSDSKKISTSWFINNLYVDFKIEYIN